MTWLVWMLFEILIWEFFWRKCFVFLSDLFWLSPGRLGAAIQIFILRKERIIFSLIPCASQTTSQTSHLHVFVLVSLCSLAMRNKEGRWLSKTQVRTESFPRTLSHPPLTDHSPTSPPSHWRVHQNPESHCKACCSNCLCDASSAGQLEIRISPFTLNMQIQFVIPSARTLGRA